MNEETNQQAKKKSIVWAKDLEDNIFSVFAIAFLILLFFMFYYMLFNIIFHYFLW